MCNALSTDLKQCSGLKDYKNTRYGDEEEVLQVVDTKHVSVYLFILIAM